MIPPPTQVLFEKLIGGDIYPLPSPRRRREQKKKERKKNTSSKEPEREKNPYLVIKLTHKHSVTHEVKRTKMALTLTASTVVASVKPTVSSNRRCVDVVRERISRRERFFVPDLFFIFCSLFVLV